MGYGKTDELAINTIRLLAVCLLNDHPNCPSFLGGQPSGAHHASQLEAEHFFTG